MVALTWLLIIDSCVTQLKAQGPSRTCNESKKEEEDRRRDCGGNAGLREHYNIRMLTCHQPPEWDQTLFFKPA